MWFLFWRDHSKGWSKVEAERLIDSQPTLAGDDGGLYEGLAVEKVSSDFPEIHPDGVQCERWGRVMNKEIWEFYPSILVVPLVAVGDTGEDQHSVSGSLGTVSSTAVYIAGCIDLEIIRENNSRKRCFVINF